MPRTQSSVDERLEQLLQNEEFPPPPEFAARAKVRDQAVYEKAAADGPAWWADQARQRLDWQTPFSSVLDDSNPPFYSWFADGRLNASYNCLDRHVEAGHGDRVAFHWRGEEGEERDVTYAAAARRRAAARQRAEGARGAQGRRGRDLPADDPRGRRGDARLRPDRRAAQRDLRRLRARLGAGAARGVGREGPDHRGRRPAQGQDGRRQGRPRRGHRRPAGARDRRGRAGDRVARAR